MEPIHLRSSIAQSQEVSRLQRVNEHLNDQARQALLRDLQHDQRREKVGSPSEVYDARIGPDRQQKRHDQGNESKEDRQPPSSRTHQQRVIDPGKGNVLDIYI